MNPSILHLKFLHWLSVNSRIQLKISMLTFTTLTTKQPTYLVHLLKKSVTDNTLRFNNQSTADGVPVSSWWLNPELQLLCVIPMFSSSRSLYQFFSPQVPQNLSVWPCFPILGLLHSGISLLTTTGCTGMFYFCFVGLAAWHPAVAVLGDLPDSRGRFISRWATGCNWSPNFDSATATVLHIILGISQVCGFGQHLRLHQTGVNSKLNNSFDRLYILPRRLFSIELNYHKHMIY